MEVTGRKYRKYIADYNNQLDIFLFKSKNNMFQSAFRNRLNLERLSMTEILIKIESKVTLN